MTYISSTHNPRVRQLRALRGRRERDALGVCFAEGIQLVLAAHQSGAPIELLVAAPDLLRSSLARQTAEQVAAHAPSIEVTAAVFRHLVGREDVQGLGAVVRQRWHALAELPAAGSSRVALDGIQYPGNLGTILRTCDAAGAAGVVLLGPTTDPYDPAAVRASTGAVFTQQLVRATPAELAAWAGRTGAGIVGATPDAPLDYRAAAYPSPVVLALGAEGRGLSPELRRACATQVRIPMVGTTDSLNLAVSAGLLLYEVFRQQRPAERAAG